MSSALQPIARGLLDGFAPLDRALRDPYAFRTLLRNLGWEKTFEDEVLSRPPLGNIAASVAELVESGAIIAATLESETDNRDPLVDELFDVIDAIEDLVAGLRDIDTASLPPSLSDPAFWAELALDLPEYLLVRYLERHQPILYGLLRLAGVIEDDEETLTGDDPERPAYVRRIVVWDNLVALVGDPQNHLRALYHWDDGQPFAHARLLDELAGFALRAAVRAERLALRETLVDGFFDGDAPPEDVRELALPILRGRVNGGLAEQGVLLAPVPPSPSREIDGLYIANLTWGESTQSIPLTPTWTLIVGGSLDATGAVGARLRPGELTFEAVPSGERVELAVEGRPTEPWMLLGARDSGVRLELNGLHVGIVFEGGADPDLILEARTLPSGDRGGIAFTIDPGEADPFVRAIVADPLEADLDLDLRWSSRSGISLGGSVGLAATIPIEKTLGPITLEAAHVALEANPDGASLLLGISASALIGPLDVVVENAGLALDLVPGQGDGVVGDLGLVAGFKPPDALGFSLELEGASGAGYASFDHEAGRYAGGAALEFVAVGLAAVVVVDTKLPGDPDGWALFCSLSLTFPSVPLGFGFFLSGVGGIVCLNRTMDVEALAGGLSSGAIDAILFPESPLEDVELIVSQLDSWFPLAQGSLVFGVAGRITWGTPKTLVTADVGVVLTFPELDLAVMGSVSIELPEETDALLELHMDVIGTIDLSEGTVMVVAALHDSSLLKTLQLSGGMAMYLSVGEHPYFLLSVGGYHPDFQPPAELPAAVTDLDRMRVELELSENAWFALEAYFAITSNTLQFGSEATLELSDKFLGVTYTARGSVGFDVLLVFAPFSFSAGIHAGVAITAGSRDNELLAVDLSARLEGPQPWHATGRASFDFFGLNASIDIEIGGTAGVEAQPPVDLLAEVEAALRDPAAWRGSTPSGADTGAVLLTADEPPADGQVWVRPDAELEVVQTVAPLERQLDRYGIYAIDGDSLLTITAAGLGGEPADHEPVLDWFAPAQYDDYRTNAEKLAAPSYEEMTGGLRFGSEGVSISPDTHNRTVTPDYEVKILDEDKTRDQPLGKLAAPLDLVTATLALDTGRRGLPGRSATTTRFTIEPPSWTIADAVTGAAIATAGSYRDALDSLHTTTAADPTTRATQRLAPAQAVLETA